jgi:hypothetical protein
MTRTSTLLKSSVSVPEPSKFVEWHPSSGGLGDSHLLAIGLADLAVMSHTDASDVKRKETREARTDDLEFATQRRKYLCKEVERLFTMKVQYVAKVQVY